MIDFTTEPKIPWEDFKTKTKLKLETPEPPFYVMEHYLIRTEIGTLWCFNEDGNLGFTRVGNQNSKILYDIMKEFNVIIYDEYGLKWPEESGEGVTH